MILSSFASCIELLKSDLRACCMCHHRNCGYIPLYPHTASINVFEICFDIEGGQKKVSYVICYHVSTCNHATNTKCERKKYQWHYKLYCDIVMLSILFHSILLVHYWFTSDVVSTDTQPNKGGRFFLDLYDFPECFFFWFFFCLTFLFCVDAEMPHKYLSA